MAFSEPELKLSGIQGRDFSTISVDDARILAEKAGNAESNMIADEFVQAAIKSGRLEILDVCWKNRHVGALFWDEYRKLPEGHLKDQLFSLKLRSTYTRWPDDNKIKIYSLNPRFGLVDFFIPVLQKIHSRPAERLFRSEYP